ncbi:hypothetical protein [Halobaculum sp. MBLA0143]|uniref:DUF7127 family protein n=1 Tax=Halobaculum sp. MBLA0143 TaxID=3079933 RepID=UPI003525077E
MTQRHSQTGAERLVRRYDYPDRTVLAVDLPGGETASVDTVDGVAIVAVGEGADADTFELELPGEPASATVNNGVVVVEVAA